MAGFFEAPLFVGVFGGDGRDRCWFALIIEGNKGEVGGEDVAALA